LLDAKFLPKRIFCFSGGFMNTVGAVAALKQMKNCGQLEEMYTRRIDEVVSVIRDLEADCVDAWRQIASLEAQLAQRTGKVERLAHPQLDAILQPTVSVSADSRLWA
jgi:hypothetical protein